MSVAEQVRETFQRLPPGAVLTSADMHHLSEDSKRVDKAVSRLHARAGLKKLRNGLYYKPWVSQYFGPLPPTAKTIISALKKQYRAKIVPSGPLAAYELGFSAMPPEERLYDSDKRIGAILLENDVLRFRLVVGKKLRAAPLDVITLLNALEFFYREHPDVSYSQRQFIRRKLSRYAAAQIRGGLRARPRWLQDRVEAIFQTSANLHYITGISALNVPYQGQVGDWHQLGMLASHKFQIAGKNYYSAPHCTVDDVFDCGAFLNQHGVELETTLCAKPARAIKDLLYTNIIVKNRYPEFFMKDQYLLPLSDQNIRLCVDQLRPLATSEQLKHLDQWLVDNDIH